VIEVHFAIELDGDPHDVGQDGAPDGAQRRH
jgi:hypothetical protein